MTEKSKKTLKAYENGEPVSCLDLMHAVEQEVDEKKAESYIRENVCNKERVFGSQSVCSDKAIRECNEHGNFCYFAKINRKSFIDGLEAGRKESKEYIRYLKRQRQGGIQKQYNKIAKINELKGQIAKLKAELEEERSKKNDR